MTRHEEYITGNRPFWFSAALFSLGMLVPVLTLMFEGWHNGVPYGVLFAIEFGILMPGIILIRLAAFWGWAVFTLLTNGVVILTSVYYLSSVPDSAEMPPNILMALDVVIWVNRLVTVGLGCFGWVKYFRIRSRRTESHNIEGEAIV